MHFVTGGAFNGKLQWVKNFYRLDEKTAKIYRFYKKEEKPAFFPKDIIVFSGLEYLLFIYYEKSEDGRKQFQRDLEQWLEWEKQSAVRKLIFIGTDITKGIVPVNKEERMFRDFIGWCYQDVARNAERVDVVWYGINEKIK